MVKNGEQIARPLPILTQIIPAIQRKNAKYSRFKGVASENAI